MAEQINITLNAIDNTKKALTDLQNNLKGIDKETKTTTASFFTFRTALIATAGVALVALSNKIIDATREFQDLRANLISATGSIKDGGDSFNYLKNYANKSIFSVSELTGAFLTLYQNGVIPTEETLKILVTTAERSTNKIETLTHLVNLFSKGAQEAGIGQQALGVLLRNNIPVFDILKAQFGGTTKNIISMFDNAELAKEALDALLEGLAERANRSGDATDNLSFKMSLFNKTIKNTLATFGETQAFNYFFDTLTKGFEQNKPLLEFLGNLLIGIVNLVTFILSTASTAMFEFFDIFKNYLKPVTDMADTIYQKLTPAFTWLAEEMKKASNAWKFLKNLQNVQSGNKSGEESSATMKKSDNSSLTEAKKQIDPTQLEKIFATTRIALRNVISEFNNLGDIISKGLIGGIKDFSKAIAESIVLGKSLQTSFADIARSILVKIISGLIEEQLIKLALLALDEIGNLLGLRKLKIIKDQNTALKERYELEGKGTAVSNEELAKKQLGSIFDELWEKLKMSFDDIYNSISEIFGSISDYSSQIFSDIGSSLMDILGNLGSSVGDIFNSIGGSLGDILGSVGNMFGGGGGGDGGFDMGTLFDIGMMIFGAAEGGALNAGQPYMVGERGRELFIPNQNGTMIPNHDLGTTGSTSINFTINATDVKGVQELLINNRATITNLVNQALNARGKSNLV